MHDNRNACNEQSAQLIALHDASKVPSNDDASIRVAHCKQLLELAELQYQTRMAVTEQGMRLDGDRLWTDAQSTTSAARWRVITDRIKQAARNREGVTTTREKGLLPILMANGSMTSTTAEIVNRHAEGLREMAKKRRTATDIYFDRVRPNMPTANRVLNLYCHDNLEVEDAIKALRRNKATGLDGVTSNQLKDMLLIRREGAADPHADIKGSLLEVLRSLSNAILCTGCQPAYLEEAMMRPLDKAGAGRRSMEVSGFRPVCWTSTISKVISTMLDTKVRRYCERHGLFGRDQMGFRRERNCQQAFMTMMQGISKYGRAGGVMCFFDFKQAYDSCSWEILEKTMMEQGWGTQSIRYLMNRVRQRVRVRDPGTGELSNPVVKEGGAPQGEILSPTLFLVYIAPILETMRRELLAEGAAPVRLRYRNKSIYVMHAAYADDYVILVRNRRLALRAYAKMSKLARAAGLTLGIKKTGVNGIGEKTAFMPFGRAAEEFERKGHSVDAVELQQAGAAESRDVPVVRAYKYLGLRISVRVIYGSSPKEKYHAVDMMPHVHCRVSMARMNGQLVTRAAVECNWGIKLHAQLLYQTTVMGMLYGSEAAVPVTGWEEVLGYRTIERDGITMNAEALETMDRLLQEVRSALVFGKMEAYPKVIGPRKPGTSVCDIEVLPADAASRVHLQLLRAVWVVREPVRNTSPWATFKRAVFNKVRDGGAGTGPLDAAGECLRRWTVRDEEVLARGATAEVVRKDAIRQLAKAEMTRIAQKALSGHSGTKKLYMDLMYATLRGNRAIPRAQKHDAVAYAMVREWMDGSYLGVFGPGAIPKLAGVQNRGNLGRLALKARCMILPRPTVLTPEGQRQVRRLVQRWQSGQGTTEQTTKLLVKEVDGRSPWTEKPWESEPIESSKGAAIPRMRYVVHRIKEEVQRKELSGFLDAMENAWSRYPTRCRMLRWRGTSLSAWPTLVTGLERWTNWGRPRGRPDERKMRGVRKYMEEIWCRTGLRAIRGTVRLRDGERKLWNRYNDVNEALQTRLVRRMAPRASLYGW